MSKRKHQYYVDIPTISLEAWENVAVFNSKREAIKFTRLNYGADRDGKISLITLGPVIDR